MSYNLLEEKWIPVLYLDGHFERVGIRRALTEAGRIRQIAASNPMDRVALLRFLVAVLYWCKGNPADREEKDQVLAADRFPADWFAKLEEQRDCFNLLGDGKRFMQDPAVWNEAEKKQEADRQKPEAKQGARRSKKYRDGISFRPVGDLLQEFPTDTKIIHFRHVRDGHYGLCPACCAAGLIRFCAFASAYAQVIPAGINGPTPAYAIRTGLTLLATLLLNWQAMTVTNDSPGWQCGCGAPQDKNKVGALAALTWRPRRIWLGELSEESVCACCSEKTRLIRRTAFGPGRKSPFTADGKDKKFWPDDPHLLLAAPEKKAKAERRGSWAKAQQSAEATQDDRAKTDGAKGQPVGFPSPNLPVGIHARFWRTALDVALAGAWPDESANALQVMGPAANKALYQDAAALHLPSIADADRGHARKWVETIGKACESLLPVLRSATPNPGRQHPNRKAALDTMAAYFEAKLKTLLLGHLASSGRATHADPLQTIEQDCARTLRHVVQATTAGSPLHRRQANRQAESLLLQEFERIQKEEP